MAQLDLSAVLQGLAAFGSVTLAIVAALLGWFTAQRNLHPSSLLRDIVEDEFGKDLPKPRKDRGKTADLSELINQTPASSPKPAPSLDLVEAYHKQGLSQANISFWFSLSFAVLGFLLIVAAAVRGMQNSADTSYISTLLPLISGTIVEAVAGLFFVQSNHARKLMADFFDKLRADRKLDESLQFSKQIISEPVASNLKAYMALRFADIEVNDPTFASIIGRASTGLDDDTTPSGSR